jgi:hypothetical protein
MPACSIILHEKISACQEQNLSSSNNGWQHVIAGPLFPMSLRRLADTGVRDQLVRILKRYGTHIRAIYFDVDDGEDIVHNGPDDPYKLTISLLYSTEFVPDEAERAAIEASKSIRSAFKSKCFVDGIHWKWIELAACEVLADTAMTVAQASFLKKWQTDYISFRSDPPEEMLREI